MLADLLSVVFVNKQETMTKVYRSFKVHVQIEETKKQTTNSNSSNPWLSKSTNSSSAYTGKSAKIINYWCFNPGFG